MIVIKRIEHNDYLFGNKTFTPNKNSARTFSSFSEARNHVDMWLDPDKVCIEESSDSEAR